MTKNEKMEIYRKELNDISVFMPLYAPNVIKKIYEQFGYEVSNCLLNEICKTAHHYEDTNKALLQIRALFRLVNLRYPLDLSVYEDTKSGRALLVTMFLENYSRLMHEKEKEPATIENKDLTPLKK